MRWLRGLSLLILIALTALLSAAKIGHALLPSPGEIEKQTSQAKSGASTPSNQQDNGHPFSTDVPVVGGKMGEAEPAKLSDQSNPYIDIQRQLVTANNRLVFATCGLILVGIGEVVLYFLALRPTTKAANAAKESADALINKDRAWVLVEVGGLPSLVPKPASGPWNPVRFEFRYGNCGSTPAWITEHAARFVRIRSYDELPAIPDYSATTVLKTVQIPVLPDKQTPWDSAFVEPNQGAMTPDEVVTVTGNTHFLFAFGYIKYRDVFGREERITQWSSRLHMPTGEDPSHQFRVEGPPGYNRNT